MDIRRLIPKDRARPTEQESLLLYRFKKAFPELTKSLHSYISNPGCACKAELIKALKDNPDKAKDVFGVLTEQFIQYSADMEEINIAGTVAIIPASIDEYRALLVSLARDNKTYKGLTIKDVPGGSWMVFFY
jgi:hypothetical protein